MHKTTLAVAALVMSAGVAVAAESQFSSDDPIGVRQALMDANGAASGLAAGMLKGEIPYNPAAAKSAIVTLHGTALAYGDFFPDDSKTGGDTTAAPAIWDDPEGFKAALEKFQSDTQAAFEASGKDGPADLEAFKAAITPVFANCKSCHEDFRVKR